MSSSRSLSSLIINIINIEKEKKKRALKFREVLKYLTCEFDFIEVNTCITFSFSIASQNMRTSNLLLHYYNYSMIIYKFLSFILYDFE